MSRKWYLDRLIGGTRTGKRPEVGKRARSMENSGLSRSEEEYQERKNMRGLTPPPGAEEAISRLYRKGICGQELISYSIGDESTLLLEKIAFFCKE